MRKKWAKKFFPSILFSLLIVFCSGQRCLADPIKIAAVFSKTGNAAEASYGYYQVIRMAVNEINKRGGVLGRSIEVIELDNESTPLGSKQAAIKAAKLGVSAVIGAAWSSHSLAMAPVLQRAGVPMVTPISTSAKVTAIGNYIFRACFIDPFQGNVMAQFALRDLRAKSAVILVNVDSDYSMGLADSFRESFMKDGGKIVYEGDYREDDREFTDILNRAKAVNADVIFLPGYEQDSAFLIKQARLMGIKSVFLGGDGWSGKMFDYVGDVVEGGYFSSHWHPEAPFPKGQKLFKDYLDHYGKEMVIYFSLAYDAAGLVFDAIERAGSTDRRAIRDALAATRDFVGATGTITIDSIGDPLNKDAIILKLENKEAVFIKSIKP